jgi:indole-3-glycerol phosphate synthase
VTGARRLSQAIAEGDGISVLVEVVDGAGAAAAQEQGAEGLVVRRAAGSVLFLDGLHLPVLAFASAQAPGQVDAVVIDVAEHGDAVGDVVEAAQAQGLECVLRVRDEDELEEVLELVDPEILLLSAEDAEEGQDHLERLLELLPDVPAGKLAIAELAGASRSDVLELERAGVDAVIVSGSDVESLVGDALPEV